MEAQLCVRTVVPMCSSTTHNLVLALNFRATMNSILERNYEVATTCACGSAGWSSLAEIGDIIRAVAFKNSSRKELPL